MSADGDHAGSGPERPAATRTVLSAPPSGSLKSLTARVGLLSVASILGQMIGFVALAVVARRLGAAEIGRWYLAVSIISFYSLPVGLGMPMLGTRDLVLQPRARTTAVIGEVVFVQFVLACAFAGFLVVLSPILSGNDAKLATLVLIAGAGLVFNALTLEWALQALGAVRRLALCRVLGQVVYGTLAVWLVSSGENGVLTYGALNMVGLGVAVAASWALTTRLVGWPRVHLDAARLFARLTRSLPFGIIFVLVQTYWNLGTVLLGYLSTPSNVGNYGVAQRIPQAGITLILVWAATLYPHAASLAAQHPEALALQIRRVVGAGITASIPLIVVAGYVGTPMMVTVFGGEFRDAGELFVWLVLLAGVTFCTVNFTNVLLAVGGERRFIRFAVGAAIAAVMLNVTLIPHIAGVAPAVATIVAELIVATFSFFRLRQSLGTLVPVLNVPAIMAATAALFGILIACAELSWLWRAGLAIVGYGGTLVLTTRVLQRTRQGTSATIDQCNG